MSNKAITILLIAGIIGALAWGGYIAKETMDFSGRKGVEVDEAEMKLEVDGAEAEVETAPEAEKEVSEEKEEADTVKEPSGDDETGEAKGAEEETGEAGTPSIEGDKKKIAEPEKALTEPDDLKEETAGKQGQTEETPSETAEKEGSASKAGQLAEKPHEEEPAREPKHAEAEDELAAQAHHASPAPWSVIPFVLLLLMIATGPLFYEHFWHKFYPLIAIGLGLLVVLYYLLVLHDQHHPVHSLAEYASFIALLTALFVASGGILINVDKAGTPMVNVTLLIIGAIVANVIGTTGASMLLIRPFIRLNKDRIKPYHIIFFIFMVSNVGGALTPIGDPPLFLGFLKGIPFAWTITHLWQPWLFGIGILAFIFFIIDKRSIKKYGVDERSYGGNIEIKGMKNIIFLAITIGAVFIDPNIYDWVPAIHYDGAKISYIRELIMFTTAFAAFKFSNEECLRGNDFNFEPIREVAFLFVGIFGTMMPALQLIGDFAANNTQMVNVDSLYWATGFLSGVLDNAPTYLNFLAAAFGKAGLDLGNNVQVMEFVQGYPVDLMAISISAVFFGAMTYIGNAPNFMVKSIAEQVGVEMPSFVGYVIRYSIPILLPVLALTWFIFFVLLQM